MNSVALLLVAQRFELHSRSRLGTNSAGINPLTEAVTLQLATFFGNDPAGSQTVIHNTDISRSAEARNANDK